IDAQTPMIVGCLISAAGIFLTRHELSHGPSFAPLMLTLGIAGIGFGLAVVPLTSAVMGAVPAEHAGMAAAATNTTRQLGSVIGVAAMGALVNAHLTSDLTARLSQLGIPANFQSIVIDAIEKGQVPNGGDASAAAAYGPIVSKVIHATYSAFRSGLEASLLVSAILVLVAAGIALAAEVVSSHEPVADSPSEDTA
ncbi:MAG: hypothetical protein ACRDPG_08735, partial [Nocardioidaceae bacterium]